jgi:Histidine kinase-, DNA gyrase B-, and HSP90-like ATPase
MSIRLCVSDTGRGIEPEELPHVFELFSQMRPADTAGVGIGLSVVREIVALHGGRVVARTRAPTTGASSSSRCRARSHTRCATRLSFRVSRRGDQIPQGASRRAAPTECPDEPWGSPAIARGLHMARESSPVCAALNTPGRSGRSARKNDSYCLFSPISLISQLSFPHLYRTAQTIFRGSDTIIPTSCQKRSRTAMIHDRQCCAASTVWPMRSE